MIDHLVYAVPDLAAGIKQLQAEFGVALSPGGRHIGLGTRNFLADLGDGAYLEVIGPDPEQPEPEVPRPFGIDGVTQPKLVTWAIRVNDIAGVISQARAKGYDPGDAIPMSRSRVDGVLLEWQVTLPGPGVVPFLIDWGTTPHPSESAARGLELVSLEGFHFDLAAIRKGLDVLGAELLVSQGEPGLRAVLRTPNGEVVLR